jgi:lysophospholipase L1-like esterase
MHNNYNDIIQRVAKDLKIPFIDSKSMLNERCFLPDGLHLTKEGYEIISNKVHELISSGSMEVI